MLDSASPTAAAAGDSSHSSTAALLAAQATPSPRSDRPNDYLVAVKARAAAAGAAPGVVLEELQHRVMTGDPLLLMTRAD